MCDGFVPTEAFSVGGTSFDGVDSTDARRQWANRSGEYSPRYYAHYGPNEASEWIREVLDSGVGTGASVLELGCSSGRHLAHLHDHGYTDLAGVEVNEEAVDVMAEVYPDAAADTTVHVDSIEAVVEEFDDDQFDAVFSVEVLQHLDPEAGWVFDELARITAERLLTVEIEGDDEHAPGEYGVNYVDEGLPLFYRNWEHVFASRGFTQTDARDVGNDTFRAFRPAGN